ncbi:MAG: TIGR03960 family B12-binding radical SAM protein [Fimbriimonadia bacterium]|jgi:radical SAM family uncharacterized protein
MSRKLIEKLQRLLQDERGTILRPHGARLRVALAFPNTYYLGMSNLGFQVVYRLFNEMPGVACERVFLPDPEDREEYRRTATPLLTVETQRAVREFDILGFSVSYEPDYPNILQILDLAGLPLRAADRDERHPLVLLGGPVTVLNPEPIAEFVDAMLVGEAEESLAQLTDAVVGAGGDRQATLEALASIPGIYVPSFYDVHYHSDGTVAGFEAKRPEVPLPVRRVWVNDLERLNTSSVITTPNTEFSNMRLTEIMRGCGRHCRFCVVGYAFLPPRFKSGATVQETYANTVVGERVGLVGASVYDHPDAEGVTTDLVSRSIPYNVSSLRADTITPKLVENMAAGGQKSITIAPEAGSERLREFINKRLTADQIRDAVATALRYGVRRVKLYYMVGLPTETIEDVEGICETAEMIRSEFRPDRISLSISCHVPKPGAPFMWAAQDPLKLLETKVRHVRSRLRKYPDVRVLGESPRMAVLEATLARGDRRVSSLVYELYLAEGSTREAFRRSGVDPVFYAQRPREFDEVFPWDIIDLGFPKSYLWKEWQRALRGQQDPPCDVSVCSRCGICPDIREQLDPRPWVGLRDYLRTRREVGSRR